MTINERIFYIMKQKNITQLELSQATGISQSTISDWKRKGTNPASDKLVVLANKGLGVDVDDLLYDRFEFNARKIVVDYTLNDGSCHRGIYCHDVDFDDGTLTIYHDSVHKYSDEIKNVKKLMICRWDG